MKTKKKPTPINAAQNNQREQTLQDLIDEHIECDSITMKQYGSILHQRFLDHGFPEPTQAEKYSWMINKII